MDIALVSSFLGNATDIIQKLKEEKVVSHEGLVIYHQENEIEYRLDLNMGDQKSRITTFKNFLKSKSLQKITIDALEASGTGMSGENLVEMGLMTWNDGKLVIDFPRIFREINSNLVIIMFKARFPLELQDKLVHRQINMVNSVKDGKLVANFEIVLDYANMWYSNYTSFSVRNISFTLNQKLPLNEIKKILMEELTNKLEHADKMALKKENARKFLTEFQKTLLEFQKPEFLEQIMGLIEINPSVNSRILNIRPSLRVYTLKHSGIPLTIPDVFIYSLLSNIEDREISIHATVTLDLEGFRNLLQEKIKSFKLRYKKLKF